MYVCLFVSVPNWNDRIKSVNLYRRRISFLQIVQTGSGAYPASECRAPFPGLRRPRRDVDQTRPSGNKVKNKFRHTSASPVCLRGVDMANFTILTFCICKWRRRRLRHCPTRREVPGWIPDGVLGNFQVTFILLSALNIPGVHSSSNRNEYQGISLGVKCGRRVEP